MYLYEAFVCYRKGGFTKLEKYGISNFQLIQILYVYSSAGFKILITLPNSKSCNLYGFPPFDLCKTAHDPVEHCSFFQ